MTNLQTIEDVSKFLEDNDYDFTSYEEVVIDRVAYLKTWYTDDNGMYHWVLEKL